MSHKNPDPEPIDIIEAEFGKALGAKDLAYREKVTLFIAHKDKEGELLSEKIMAHWVRIAETVLSKIGGGATTIEVQGAWLGNNSTPIYEPTTLVYSYASPKVILDSINPLREFLYQYGKATNQGEVALLLENPDGDWFFRIPEEEYRVEKV